MTEATLRRPGGVAVRSRAGGGEEWRARVAMELGSWVVSSEAESCRKLGLE